MLHYFMQKLAMLFCRICFGIFLLAFSFTLFSQNVWYFGNGAGIEFTPFGAKPVVGGKIFTNEGCSAAYDENGNLLFYTDGRSVWDKNHQLLQNGEGLNGDYSSTQSALAVPKPQDKNTWYIFTADAFAGKNGICYSVVNVAEGKIIEKNHPLLPVATEKLAATLHANEKDFWLLTHQWNSNKFYAYPITEYEIGAPIVSQIGVLHNETGSGKNRESIGEMKFSPDGKKVAIAICYRSKNNLEVFDFDNATGRVSNPQTIEVNGFPYGVCFSPGGSKLYVSFLKGTSGIVQYDLQTKKIAEIVKNNRENSFGSLQIGPDGKIYIARNSNFLDVIVFPEKEASASGYTKNAVNLTSASATFGLPAFVVWKRTEVISLISVPCNSVVAFPFSQKESKHTTEIVTCEEKYMLDAKNFGASYTWSTRATTRTILVDTSGLYKVIVQKEGCVITDSVMVRFKKDMAIFRYLPQFNPESEFMNSEFFYSIEEVSGFELKIYDSRKKLIFETNDESKKWNGRDLKGKLVPAGEYTWKVKFTPNCPKGSKQVKHEGKVIVTRNKK
jgi:hypothetical protein